MRRSIAAWAAACLLLVACGGGSDGETASPTDGGQTTAAGTATAAPPTQSPDGVAPATGLCANPYMPSERGVTWDYAVATSAVDSEYRDVVTAVRTNGFTVTSEFPDLTKRSEWACTPEGLVALQYGAGASASISSSGTEATFRTADVQGVTIPVDPQPGDTWTQSFDVRGEQTIPGGVTATTRGKIRLEFEATGFEDLSVAAGDYRALKVDLRVVFDLTAAVQDASVPFSFTFTGTVWYAEGVGAVKTTTRGELFGGRIAGTTELTAFAAPAA